ncbi:MAG: hypothetical protein V1731_03330 [Candidatus Aenigmatarchaeota archaeon]
MTELKNPERVLLYINPTLRPMVEEAKAKNINLSAVFLEALREKLGKTEEHAKIETPGQWVNYLRGKYPDYSKFESELIQSIFAGLNKQSILNSISYYIKNLRKYAWVKTTASPYDFFVFYIESIKTMNLAIPKRPEYDYEETTFTSCNTCEDRTPRIMKHRLSDGWLICLDCIKKDMDKYNSDLRELELKIVEGLKTLKQ